MSASETEPPEDDPEIADTELLYRRIHPKQMVPDANTGEHRVSSGDWDDESGLVSIYLGTGLEALGVAPIDILDGHPLHTLVVVDAKSAREVGMGVIRDPDPDDPHPRAPAHGLLTGLHSNGKQARRKQRRPLAKASRVIELRGQSQTATPNGGR